MNFNQLKYFSAVCVCRTVSAAAEYLHISQPSLSNAIKELEEEFGVKLFYRQHSGMVLTDEGERFFKMSSELLNRAEQTENIMKDIGKQRKILRLGVPPMIGSVILPKIYREFLSENPEINIEITEGGQQELTKLLSDGMLDMIFVPHENSIDKNFSSVNIARTEIVCCVSENSELATKNSVAAKDLLKTPIVLFKDGFYHTEKVRQWFGMTGIKPDITLRTEQLSTIQTLVSNNVAAGFMFRPLVNEEKGFRAISTEPRMDINISLVWKKDSYLFSSMKRLREYVERNNLF